MLDLQLYNRDSIGNRWNLTLEYAFLSATPFCSVQVMLLAFVLLGRTLEERARVKASSDMNELLVSFSQILNN